MISDAGCFIDEYGTIHEQDMELGRGGQGVVFRTKDPDVAVKLALDSEGRPIRQRSYIEKLRAVRVLPIPTDLHLSMPVAILRDRAGYAMRLLNDMVSFRQFESDQDKDDRNGSQDIPAWLTGAPPQEACKLLQYIRTGSLRRRLLALYKSAAILARLHAAGLVYGDVSLANVYMSSDPASREVWLIDVDNLRFETENQKLGVYTPGFGAPELVQGREGSSSRTDCHAFAVLAFWILTLQHPFVGEYVESGGDCDWADDNAAQEDLTEKAYAGLLPWIDDEVDNSNATTKGLPRTLMLTLELKRLFQETFGPGRIQPWHRPVMFHWPPALARALDQTILCPSCRMTYYHDGMDARQCCPFCDAARPALLRATASTGLGGAPASSECAWRWVHELPADSSRPLMLPHRLFHPFSISAGDRDILEISMEQNGVLLRSCDGAGMHQLAAAVRGAGVASFAEFAATARLPEVARRNGFSLLLKGTSPRIVDFHIEEAVP